MPLVAALHPIAIFSIFAIGLIAGQMLAIAIANYAARDLPETSWTLRFQVENALFTRTMPPSLMAPVIGLISLCFLTRGQAREMFAIATLLGFLVLALTMAINVPINRQVQSWTAGAAPATWMATRDKWLWFHVVRTIAGLLSFVVAAIGLSCL